MAKARVEVATLGSGYVNTTVVANVVYALRLANRVVEVDWRNGHLSFSAVCPVPRAVRIPANKKTAGSSTDKGAKR